jgi:hypothetical protein
MGARVFLFFAGILTLLFSCETAVTPNPLENFYGNYSTHWSSHWMLAGDTNHYHVNGFDTLVIMEGTDTLTVKINGEQFTMSQNSQGNYHGVNYNSFGSSDLTFFGGDSIRYGYGNSSPGGYSNTVHVGKKY